MNMALDFIDRVENIYWRRVIIALIVLVYSIFFLLVAFAEIVKDSCILVIERFPEYKRLYEERCLAGVKEKW